MKEIEVKTGEDGQQGVLYIEWMEPKYLDDDSRNPDWNPKLWQFHCVVIMTAAIEAANCLREQGIDTALNNLADGDAVLVSLEMSANNLEIARSAVLAALGEAYATFGRIVGSE